MGSSFLVDVADSIFKWESVSIQMKMSDNTVVMMIILLALVVMHFNEDIKALQQTNKKE